MKKYKNSSDYEGGNSDNLLPPPPHNEDAEIAALGSAIINGNLIDKISSILTADDFYFDKHKKIFATMVEMSKKKISIDLVTLTNELKSKDIYEEIGEYKYLMYLIDLTPTSENFKHYCDIVNEFSCKRKIIFKASTIISGLSNNEIDTESAISEMLDIDIQFDNKSNLQPVSASKLLEEDSEPLQSLWGDMIYPSCITQINSEPGVGKTTFLYNLCVHGVTGNRFLEIPFSKDLKVLYLDVETPHRKRGSKLRIISESSLPDELYFLYTLELKSDFSYLLNLCKKEKYDVVVFDTQSRIFNLEQENDNSEANRIMGLLRRLANDTDCSIILVHHTSKTDRKGVYSGRGASAIGGAVDVVINMEMLEEDVIQLKVEKN